MASCGRELIDRQIFTTLLEAKVLIERWWQEYNRERPHGALGNLVPLEYASLVG